MKCAFSGILLAAAAGFSSLPAGETITFTKTTLDTKFRSEGVAVGDFNKDGKLDIAAGSVFYAAPDWKMHTIADKAGEYDPLNYSNSFGNFVDDVNGDGWDDLLVVDFPGKETWWWENPQATGETWQRHACIEVTNNESPTYLDIDGDGKRELICSALDRYFIARKGNDSKALWKIAPFTASLEPRLTHQYYHGLGIGDVNKDGRQDVIIPDGWWEAPADPKQQREWVFHKVNFGPSCAQMYAYDFDGDGDSDVLSSSAHQVGIWWHEQTKEGWKTHEIDNSFSQTHSLVLADINGDGLHDFVTGKRWWAHGPKGDVNPDHPAVMCWFELTRKEGKPAWIKHQFDDNSGIGTQFQVADVDGDKLLDVVTSNKKGVHYFRQVRVKE